MPAAGGAASTSGASAAGANSSSSTLVAYSVTSSNVEASPDGNGAIANLSLTPVAMITVPQSSGDSVSSWGWSGGPGYTGSGDTVSGSGGPGFAAIATVLNPGAFLHEIAAGHGLTAAQVAAITNQGGGPGFGGSGPLPPFQQLPDQQSVSVAGYLNNALSGYYVVPTGENTSSMHVDLTGLPGGYVQVYLPDGTSYTSAMIAGGPHQDVSMEFPIPTDRVDRQGEVILKVASSLSQAQSGSSSGAGPTSPASDGFTLQVTREEQSGTPLTGPKLGPGETGADGSTVSASLGQSATAGAPRSAPTSSGSSATAEPSESSFGQAPVVASASVAASAGLQVAMSPVATGPLPERAGATPGGVLTDGDPVPQLDRHDPAVVDLALIGLTSPAADVGDGDAELAAVLREFDGDGDDATEVGETLVAVRGPGGFPLLAASLHKEAPSDIEALVAALPAETATMEAVARVQLPDRAAETVASATTSPAEADADGRQAAGPSGGIRPATSVLSGVSVALAMVFGLVLPDLTTLLSVSQSPRSRLRFASLLRRRARA
jgi:hypothetical protein